MAAHTTAAGPTLAHSADNTTSVATAAAAATSPSPTPSSSAAAASASPPSHPSSSPQSSPSSKGWPPPTDIRIGWVNSSILTTKPHDQLPFNESSVQHEEAPWMIVKRHTSSATGESAATASSPAVAATAAAAAVAAVAASSSLSSSVAAPDEQVVVERAWLEAQVPSFQRSVHASFPGDSLRLVDQPLPRPHPVDSFNKTHLHMFTLFFRAFDYHIWWNSAAVPNVRLLKLEPRHKRALNKCIGRCTSGRPLDSSQLEDLVEVRDLLRSCFTNWDTCDGTEWFVRVSGCSGKRDEPLRPLTSVRGMLDFLTSCRNFYAREFQQDKDSFIVVTPWLHALQPRLELRLFVHEGRLTAASQQHCYTVYRYSANDLAMLKAALSGRDASRSLQRLIDSVCYKSFVADAFIDPATGELRLIECNPFGAFSGSGGALFSWVHDANCLRAEHHEHTPVLRLLAAPPDEDEY